jgi:hypothetical protein
VDGTYVYWTDLNGYAVMKVPIAGGSATTLAAAPGGPYGIVVDGTSVYWAEGGAVKKLTPK